MEQVFVTDRLALMPEHFGAVGDPRESCKVRYPLREVLFLVTCATIAGCDDCDRIADRGILHRDFLKEYGKFRFGTPKEDWLRVVLNRIDPALFEACFTARARGLRPGAADLIALDGKSLRRSGETGAQIRPVHLVPARASTRRLVLAQEAVKARDSECAALRAILERLTLRGARVTIDAIAANPTMAGAVLAGGGDCLLALKHNQPALHDEVAAHFEDPATTGLATVTVTDKDQWPHRNPHHHCQP